jgi:serine phosphatase RsbU (regulator of sigma subunit)
MDPPLDPRLKIFAYDDNSVSFFGDPEVSFKNWVSVLGALEARNPKMIFVDKIFGFPSGLDQLDLSQIKRFENVVVGALAHSTSITGREKVPSYRLEQFSSEKDDIPKKFVYGPNSSIEHLFGGIGHILYEGRGRIFPYVGVEGSLRLNHLTLKDYDGIQTIPVDENKAALVNLSKSEIYSKRLLSMKPLINRANSQGIISVVNEGDYVLILPGFFTGSTDFVETPLGIMPGGYIIAAVLNSRLRNDWLTEPKLTFFLTVSLAVLGIALSLILGGASFWIGLSATSILFVALSIAVFCLSGVVVDWLFPLLAMTCCGSVTAIHRIQKSRLEQFKVETELETARLVQMSFFPDSDESIESLDLAGKSIAAAQCSGDWWIHYTLDSTKKIVVVGDATGHGVAPALLTAAIWACFKTLISEGRIKSPKDFVNTVNDLIKGKLGNQVWMTAFVGIFDMQEGTLTYLNQAHNPALYLKASEDPGSASRRASQLSGNGDPIGGIEKTSDEMVLPFSAGDQFFIYTDGLTECLNSKGEMYKLKRLRKEFVDMGGNSSIKILDHVFDSISTFTGRSPLMDDATAVVVTISRHWKLGNKQKSES